MNIAGIIADLSWVTRQVQRAVLWAGPAGGQRRARRNAWAAMAADNRRRADRAEAHQAAQAAARAEAQPSVAVPG